jgi:hypothetical protein
MTLNQDKTLSSTGRLPRRLFGLSSGALLQSFAFPALTLRPPLLAAAPIFLRVSFHAAIERLVRLIAPVRLLRALEGFAVHTLDLFPL